MKKYFQNEIQNVKLYKYDEIIDSNWINIKNLSPIDLSNQVKDIGIHEFSPKYRMILNILKDKELM